MATAWKVNAKHFADRYAPRIQGLATGILAVTAGKDGHAEPAIIIRVADVGVVKHVHEALATYGERDNLTPVDREFLQDLSRLSICYQPETPKV